MTFDHDFFKELDTLVASKVNIDTLQSREKAQWLLEASQVQNLSDMSYLYLILAKIF